jgi:hypothetical protein
MRHHSRIRCVLLLALVPLLAFPGTAPQAKEKTWVVTVLEGPSGHSWTGTFGNDVSDSGSVVGAWFDADELMHAAYWVDGVCHDLESEIGAPEGTTQSYLNTVNAHGLMGGGIILDDGSYRAVLWDVTAETYKSLHPAGYAGSRVYTVNASGDAVGWVETTDGVEVAWVWPKGGGTGQALPGQSDYDNVRANAINSSGMIVGQGQDGTWMAPGSWELPVWVPLVWIRKGQSWELVDIREDCEDGLPMIRAYDVSEDGEVVGRRWDEFLYTAAWSWTAEDGYVELDDDETGDGSAWRVVGQTVAGGIGFGPLGNSEQDWISDDAAIWVKGKLEIVATEVEYDGETYAYVDGASINRKGVATGFCFRFPADPPYLPLGWMAEKK